MRKEDTMPNTFWPEGKRAAISLTFDDARPSQIDNGLPILDAHNLKATFYVSIRPMQERILDWKQALQNGHEIGNHTLTHPCGGNFTFSKNNALEDYTLEKIESEIVDANSIIQKELGITPKTFAYPCGQKFVGRGQNLKSYVPLVAEHFLVGRDAFNHTPNTSSFTDLAQITSFDMDGVTFDQLKTKLEDARQQNAWITFLGHEINRKGEQTVLTSTLEKLCDYLSQSDFWIDTVENIGTYTHRKRIESKDDKL